MHTHSKPVKNVSLYYIFVLIAESQGNTGFIKRYWNTAVRTRLHLALVQLGNHVGRVVLDEILDHSMVISDLCG